MRKMSCVFLITILFLKNVCSELITVAADDDNAANQVETRTTETQATLTTSRRATPITHLLRSAETESILGIPCKESVCSITTATLITENTSEPNQTTIATSSTSTEVAAAAASNNRSTTALKASRVSSHLVAVLGLPLCEPKGMTKLRGFICIICVYTSNNNRLRTTTLYVYEDSSPFDLLAVTVAELISRPRFVVGNENANALYVIGDLCNCVWKINLDNHIVVLWLAKISQPFSVVVTNDGRTMLTNYDEDLPRLFVYDEDAKLLQIIPLSHDLRIPFNIIEKENGQFIVSFTSGRELRIIVSLLDPKAQLISQTNLRVFGFYFRKNAHFCFDAECNRLILAEMITGSALMFDLGTVNLTSVEIRGRRSCSWMNKCDTPQWIQSYDTKKRQVLSVISPLATLEIVQIEEH